MTAPSRCRLIVESAPRDGVVNMAVDEVLLESALGDGVCTLRWYRWSEPTVSLGYFQPAISASAPHAPEGLHTLPQVRRLSGGGAILHHHEWTYSLAVAPAHPLAAHPEQLYRRVHERLIAWLQQHSLDARLRNEAFDKRGEPFLCFGRGDPNDIVVGRHKVVGSAQRRRRGAVLQHGSLLLSKSEWAPDYVGLLDLGLPAEPPLASIDELAKSIGGDLWGECDDGAYTTGEIARIGELVDSRYGSKEWTFHQRR